MIPDWTLREPLVAWVVAAVAIVVGVARARAARRRGAPAGAARLLGGAALPRSWRDRLAWVSPVCATASVVALGVALAEPTERVVVSDEVEGIDILLCLDVSSSMTARDLDGERTRLDVARDAAKRFVASRPDDRIGVVSFARYPDLRAPTTLDHAAVADVLDALAPVEPDSEEDATGIGTALARAASALSTTRRPTRVVVLLTDGEENVASERDLDEIAPVHAAQLCERLGVRVYTIVAGDVEAAGLDTRQVERVAERTGGVFFVARDASSIDAVYASIDALERAPTAIPRVVDEPRHAALVALAVALFLAGRASRGVVGAVA